MPQAIELLRQGKSEELWQMCCGYLKLDLDHFMEVQTRLLEEQLVLLNNCALGQKIMKGARPRTIQEFRKQVPLTSYDDYAPDFMEKREDILPDKQIFWVRTSGRTGDYPCKWVPMSYKYAHELSIILYGVGMLSCCQNWGDVSKIPDHIKLLYSVAPRPYISGTFADLLRLQTPLDYLPNLEESEKLTFEERVRLGFEQAMSQGLDYFFGLSLVLVMVGEKLRESSNNINILSLLKKPKALTRIIKGKIHSKIENRELLPKDLWKLRGIIGSGVDSWIHKDKIYRYWGKYPLDIYSATESGVIATQTWDYEGMTFTPNLNFLEFIPEEEKLKWEMDHSYQPNTLLLNEVRANEVYEIVLTNFHGGAMIRYKLGDMVRITSLRNEKLGINIPQMQFERRADDLISFMVIKLTEKQIWQSIENSNIAYEDWTAYKRPGESVLHILIEPKRSWQGNETELLETLQKNLVNSGRSSYDESGVQEDWRDELGFQVEVTLLPSGSFANYIALKQAEGADPAHLKPPHINPSNTIISTLLAETEEVIVVTKNQPPAEKKAEPEEEEKPDKITI
jgi:hypothetical protein